MIAGIKREQHGFTDYSYVPLVMAAPNLIGFKDNKTATNVSRAIGAGVLAYSLATNARWGAWKLIPYKTHAVLDLANGAVALASPWLFKFADDKKARNTFLAMASIGFVVGVLSIIGAKKS